VFINVGILLAYLAGIPYERDFSGFNLGGRFVAWWRVMVGLQLVPAALQAVALLGSPESPVWLEGAGHSEAADESFLALWVPVEGALGGWGVLSRAGALLLGSWRQLILAQAPRFGKGRRRGGRRQGRV
jgi:hypothetical protein